MSGPPRELHYLRKETKYTEISRLYTSLWAFVRYIITTKCRAPNWTEHAFWNRENFYCSGWNTGREKII